MAETEIPEDVREAADACWNELATTPIGNAREFETEVIARAILAERERAANEAVQAGKRLSEPAVGHYIALAIRNPSP